MLGIIERPADRGGHSVYASLVYIDAEGRIRSVHRKLMPTYEERLAWSPGDGHGLRVHRLGAFTVGGLNCWENWMPLPRAALYGLGEDLHVAVWPGNLRNTAGHHPLHRRGGPQLRRLGLRPHAPQRLPGRHAAPGRHPGRLPGRAGQRRLVPGRAGRKLGGRARASARRRCSPPPSTTAACARSGRTSTRPATTAARTSRNSASTASGRAQW